MSNPAKYRKDFLAKLNVSIFRSFLKRRDLNPNWLYASSELQSKLEKLYDDIYNDPMTSVADVVSRMYRVRDIIVCETWDFEPLLSGPIRNLMQELDVRYRDAETVRDICNSVRKRS